MDVLSLWKRTDVKLARQEGRGVKGAPHHSATVVSADEMVRPQLGLRLCSTAEVFGLMFPGVGGVGRERGFKKWLVLALRRIGEQGRSCLKKKKKLKNRQAKAYWKR